MNDTTKWHRLAEWIQNKIHIFVTYKRITSDLGDSYTLKVREWKRVFDRNGNQKKARVTILILDIIDFKINTATINKEGHFIMIKG